MHLAWDLISLVSGGRVRTRMWSRSKTIYLTFDDGPHPDNTASLIRLLEKYDAKATFFLVGSKVEQNGEVVKSLIRSGHRLGNHSFSHRRLKTLTMSEMRKELALADAAMKSIDGHENHVIRPPWGQIRLSQLLYCIFSGKRVALWSRDSCDYKDSAEQIIRRFRETPLVGGDVVLFHDDGPVAQAALEALLPEWRAAGYELAALP